MPKESKESHEGDAVVVERKLHVSPIARPLAGKKLTKRILKLVKKASKEKSVRRGVKEVVKAIRKKEKGICILAGDISPIDVISHVPVLCEDNSIPYCYVPSKEDLGAASQTKRPTSCTLINLKENSELKSKFQEVVEEMKGLEM